LRERVCTSREHEVESLLEIRKEKKDNTWSYLVKWVGYIKPTWEPAHSIQVDCPDLVSDFQNKNRLAIVAAAAALPAAAIPVRDIIEIE